MSGAPVKRFIAGAICPRCARPDRVVAWDQDGRRHRECVTCGFNDWQEVEPPATSVPDGRFDAARPPAPATTKAVRFYPRSGSKSR